MGKKGPVFFLCSLRKEVTENWKHGEEWKTTGWKYKMFPKSSLLLSIVRRSLFRVDHSLSFIIYQWVVKPISTVINISFLPSFLQFFIQFSTILLKTVWEPWFYFQLSKLHSLLALVGVPCYILNEVEWGATAQKPPVPGWKLSRLQQHKKSYKWRWLNGQAKGNYGIIISLPTTIPFSCFSLSGCCCFLLIRLLLLCCVHLAGGGRRGRRTKADRAGWWSLSLSPFPWTTEWIFHRTTGQKKLTGVAWHTRRGCVCVIVMDLIYEPGQDSSQ